MDFLRVVHLLGLQLSQEQLRACEYLERQGQQFCADFGYINCVEKAREHWKDRRRTQQRKRRNRAW